MVKSRRTKVHPALCSNAAAGLTMARLLRWFQTGLCQWPAGVAPRPDPRDPTHRRPLALPGLGAGAGLPAVSLSLSVLTHFSAALRSFRSLKWNIRPHDCFPALWGKFTLSGAFSKLNRQELMSFCFWIGGKSLRASVRLCVCACVRFAFV